MPFRPSDNLTELEAVSTLENCILDVPAWMREDMLWLNDDKTEFLLIGSRQQLAKVSINSIKAGEANVVPVSASRNGICLLIYPNLAEAHSTISITFVISGNTSQRRILNSWFMPSSQVDRTTFITRFTVFPIVR